jgi:hypothetical protein
MVCRGRSRRGVSEGQSPRMSISVNQPAKNPSNASYRLSVGEVGSSLAASSTRRPEGLLKRRPAAFRLDPPGPKASGARSRSMTTRSSTHASRCSSRGAACPRPYGPSQRPLRRRGLSPNDGPSVAGTRCGPVLRPLEPTANSGSLTPSPWVSDPPRQRTDDRLRRRDREKRADVELAGVKDLCAE